jgi:midasin
MELLTINDTRDDCSLDARSRQHGMMGNPDTAQLLLIVSDGRGLFMEGMETVKSAVRQARESNIFLVFVIIDNPVAKVLHR